MFLFGLCEQFVYKNPMQFENLTRHKITFISQKVYQKDARYNRNGMADGKPVLTEFADFSKQSALLSLDQKIVF
jgi:hypothetical protein